MTDQMTLDCKLPPLHLNPETTPSLMMAFDVPLVARIHTTLQLCSGSVANYLAKQKGMGGGDLCVCVWGLSATVAFNEPHASYQAWRSTNSLIRPHGGRGSTDRV